MLACWLNARKPKNVFLPAARDDFFSVLLEQLDNEKPDYKVIAEEWNHKMIIWCMREYERFADTVCNNSYMLICAVEARQDLMRSLYRKSDKNDETGRKRKAGGKKSERKKKIDHLPPSKRILLKRSFGTMINDADVSTMSVFYELFPGISEKEESRCFAAACCHCLWDVNDGPAIPMEEAIGKMLRTSATASDSLKKRVWKMLDTRWDESGISGSLRSAEW